MLSVSNKPVATGCRSRTSRACVARACPQLSSPSLPLQRSAATRKPSCTTLTKVFPRQIAAGAQLVPRHDRDGRVYDPTQSTTTLERLWLLLGAYVLSDDRENERPGTHPAELRSVLQVDGGKRSGT